MFDVFSYNYLGSACSWLVPAVFFGLADVMLDVATAGTRSFVWLAFSGLVHVTVFFICPFGRFEIAGSIIAEESLPTVSQALLFAPAGIYGLLCFCVGLFIYVGLFWLTFTAAIIADDGNDDPRKPLLRSEVSDFVYARGICLLSWSACTVILLVCIWKRILFFNMQTSLLVWVVPVALFGLLDVVTTGTESYVWFACSGLVHIMILSVCFLLANHKDL
jgi:hypothetical protein